MKHQRGFTFWGFVFTVGPILALVLVALMLFPAYTEFFAVKKAVERLGKNAQEMSDGEIRAAMDKSLEVEASIKHIKSTDLIIQHSDNGGTVVSVDYEVVVPLAGNLSALLNFTASSDKSKSPR